MKLNIITTIFIAFLSISLNAQSSFEKEVLDFQSDLNKEYQNPEESPLPKNEQETFKGHRYFPIDELYKVQAKFIKNENPVIFQMKTSTNRLPNYKIYGVVEFEIKAITYSLNIYQSQNLENNEEYKDYLFLPFTDITNGKETYEGGRYIDLKIPSGDTIIVDFNKAYNPFCAYSNRYSCPKPPVENNLNVKIKAGIKKPR